MRLDALKALNQLYTLFNLNLLPRYSEDVRVGANIIYIVSSIAAGCHSFSYIERRDMGLFAFDFKNKN